MDENKGPSSYDAPKPGEYGKPESDVTDNKDTVGATTDLSVSDVNETVTENTASVASEDKDTIAKTVAYTSSEVNDTVTDIASSAVNSSTSASESTGTSNSAFKLADNTTQSGSASTSHQEVFGGQVEGTASPQNNYYTNTATSYGAPEEISKGFGIASLVMGILCILTCCCWFLSIIFGVLGIIFFCVQPKDSNGSRPTQATIGLVLSIVGLVLSIGIIAVGVLSANSSWYQEFMNSTNM